MRSTSGDISGNLFNVRFDLASSAGITQVTLRFTGLDERTAREWGGSFSLLSNHRKSKPTESLKKEEGCGGG